MEGGEEEDHETKEDYLKAVFKCTGISPEDVGGGRAVSRDRIGKERDAHMEKNFQLEIAKENLLTDSITSRAAFKYMYMTQRWISAWGPGAKPLTSTGNNFHGLHRTQVTVVHCVSTYNNNRAYT